MPTRCSTVRMPGGGVALARVQAPAPRPCHHCGAPSTKLCDACSPDPRAGRGVADTCDRPLCDRCAIHVAPDTDYCRDHAPELAR